MSQYAIDLTSLKGGKQWFVSAQNAEQSQSGTPIMAGTHVQDVRMSGNRLSLNGLIR